MCGIAGILHSHPERPVNRQAMLRMRDLLRHRGPDDDGIATDGPCGLCHTRLAILDLSPRGHQPMRSPTGRYWISFNGEIYNYRDLRQELRADGRSFESDTDTEVILHLMESAGVAGLERLEGMFAFALYDRERRELVLMRDRAGIKPLFWTRDEDGFAFASEPKALPEAALRAQPTVERLAEYVSFRHWAGTECPLPDVHTLLPGHRLVTNGRDVSIERWWAPHATHRAVPEDTAPILSTAVRRQLMSDVPLGIFLSGGVDSALVAAAACETLPDAETFTVGFHEESWDETARAHVVVRQLGTRTHQLRLDADDYASGLGEAVWHLDAPLNHAHSVHLLALSRLARRRITVALTGEGSDEFFAGYPRYRLLLLAERLRNFPGGAVTGFARRFASHARVRRLLAAACADESTRTVSNAAFVPIDEAARLVGLSDPERALSGRRAIVENARRDGLDALGAALDLDRQTYLVSLLQRMDRMSMAVGLECRVPFLDERVMEHAVSLPLHERIDAFDTKKPLRRDAAARFGRRYANAPKSGFGVPLNEWFRRRGRLATLLADVLNDDRTRTRGWFDVDLARRLHEQHRSGTDEHTDALWAVLNLELWARVCLDGDGPGGARMTNVHAEAALTR